MIQMTAKNPKEDQAVVEPAPTDNGDRGRLVLASGAIVSVPVEGMDVTTHHHDAKIGVTVPVTSRFVVD